MINENNSIIDLKKVDKIRSCVNLIKKSFECTICIDYFDDPVITNCQHAFCKKCIENYIGNKRFQNCPLCKNSINLRSLKKYTSLNYYVQNTKKLEQAFENDLKKLKLTNQNNNQINDSSLSSASIIGIKRKRRTLSNGEEVSDKTKKKLKNDLSTTTTSLITSTRDDFQQLSESSKPINIIEDTIFEEKKKNTLKMESKDNNNLNLSLSESTLNTNKVNEWFEKNIYNQQSSNSDLSNFELNTNNDNNNNKNRPLEDSTNRINNLNLKSSISISRIGLRDKKINNENEISHKLLPIINSIDDVSTAPVSTRELVINEADVGNNNNNNNNNEKEKQTNVNNKSNNNEIDYPLKFTESNTSTSTTPRLNKTKFTTPQNKNINHNKHTLKTTSTSTDTKKQKSFEKVLYDSEDSNELPPLNLEFNFDQSNFNKSNNTNRTENNLNTIKCVDTVKKVRFNSNLKRSQSDTNLKQNYKCKSCALSSLSSNKNTLEKSTNTTEIIQADICIQVDEDDLFNSMFDYEQFESSLIEKIYSFEEEKIINRILDNYLRSIIDIDKQNHQQSIQSIPDSPPTNSNQTTSQIDESIVLREQQQQQQSIQDISLINSNESVNRKSAAFLKENFNDLLNSIGVNNKKGVLQISQRQKKPSLEFLTNTKSSKSAIVIDNSINNNNQTIDDTIPFENGYESVARISQSLIIEDTPVKSQNESEDLREVNETLSKSATRLEPVINKKKISIENSIVRYDNSFSKINKQNEFNQLIITDTVQLNEIIQSKESMDNLDQTEIILNNNNDNLNDTLINTNVDLNSNENRIDNKKPVELKKIHQKQIDNNNTLLLNSLNMTNYQILSSNTPPLMLSFANTFNNVDKIPPQPPLARDILGISIANESTYVDTRSASPPQTKNSIEQPPIMDSIQTKTNNSVNKKNDDRETLFLTDSACNMIEDICKDFYSIQNQTICEEEQSNSNQSRPVIKQAVTSSNSKKYEFVFSLLSTEMKIIVNNFAKNNNINIANDVTESTTHLIVDSDKNLLCGVTCKYLKAITRKLWIVSVAWILNCINTGQFLKPDKFEIKGDKSFGVHNGPMLSRLSKQFLYESFEFLFIGEFLSVDSVSLEDITQLVALNRGIVRRKAKDFSQDDTNKRKIVIFDEKAKKISIDIAKSLKENQIDCVNKSWLIDSLACFKLRDLQEYQTYQ